GPAPSAQANRMTPSPSSNGSPLLAVEDLTVGFARGGQYGSAVNGASFVVRPGEGLGLVGEPGGRKSVTALAILRLTPAPRGRSAAGRTPFGGRDLLHLPPPAVRRRGGPQVSMIFQAPPSALIPVMALGAQVAEAIAAHRRLPRRAAWEAAVEMLRRVG